MARELGCGRSLRFDPPMSETMEVRLYEEGSPREKFYQELDKVLAGVGQEQDRWEDGWPVESVADLCSKRWRTIKTTSGPMTVERQRVRNASKLARKQDLGKGVARTHAPSPLVTQQLLAGLSVPGATSRSDARSTRPRGVRRALTTLGLSTRIARLGASSWAVGPLSVGKGDMECSLSDLASHIGAGDTNCK
jgi:hypothetical protein